jgi:hypothetical protein
MFVLCTLDSRSGKNPDIMSGDPRALKLKNEWATVEMDHQSCIGNYQVRFAEFTHPPPISNEGANIPFETVP